MIESAAIVLTLPDNRHIVQRRDNETAICPNMLAYFGGRIEDSDFCSRAGAARELTEELKGAGQDVELERITDFLYLSPFHEPPVIHVNVYAGKLATMPSEVFEGVRAEALTADELLTRQDVADSTKCILKTIGGY